MKLSTFATPFALSTALAAVLEPRQQCSSSDACYSAVFGGGDFLRVVQAVEDCEDFLTTSVIWHPMYVNAVLGDVYLELRLIMFTAVLLLQFSVRLSQRRLHHVRPLYL